MYVCFMQFFSASVFYALLQEDNEWETDAIKKELKEEVMKDGGDVLLEG